METSTQTTRYKPDVRVSKIRLIAEVDQTSSLVQDPLHPDIPIERSNSAHFATAMPAERAVSTGRSLALDTDEITPIRNADGNADRSYHTTEPPSSGGNGARQKKPSDTSSNVQQEERRSSWVKRVVDKYGSVRLENKGSVARDHLALERTFLAWLRTSLAFASIGIAITQLFRLNTSTQARNQSTVSPIPSSTLLPLSPMLGISLPPELIPLLQQLVVPTTQMVSPALIQNTLLDQLLALPHSNDLDVAASAGFDEHAAQRLRRAGKPLGATFIAISIIVLLVGFHRYFEAQYWIIRGKFPASRGSIALVGLIAAALIISSLVVILVVAPTSYQKA